MVNNTIGIIGGMGPFASAYFYKLLLTKSVECYGAKSNDDFPRVLMDSLPVPDFISNLNNLEKAKSMLVSTVRKLNKYGVRNIGMVCNTGHLIYEELATASKVDFISMIDLVTKEVTEKSCKRVVILATPTTIKFNLYGKFLADVGIEIFYPPKNVQKMHETIIRKAIGGKKEIELVHQLKTFAKDFCKIRSLDALILGCTELPLVFPKDEFNGRIIDPMELLADELLVRYYK